MENIRLKRYSGNPILTKTSNEWEKASIYNVATIQHDGHIHMLYRATDKNTNGKDCADYLNYIGYAKSEDGINFTRRNTPVLSPLYGQERRGAEDPRVVCIDKLFYMTYTGYGNRYPGDFKICLATSKDLIHWDRKGVILDEKNKDGSLFPVKIDNNFVLIHRRSTGIHFTKTPDFKVYHEDKIIADITTNDWENFKIGLAGPPIETEEGWILIYHGVSKKLHNVGSKRPYRQYSLGFMLLDKNDPYKVVYRQEDPILIPELSWEKFDGYVPNVVFSCGHAIIKNKLFVYYGGGDSVTGLATVDMNEFKDIFIKL